MTIKAHEFDRIIKKYGFKTRRSGDQLAWLEHEGQIVARTKRSNIKGKDLPLQYAIRQQLHLNQEELRLAISCKMQLSDYIELLRQKGKL
jgi:hypothetical protein